VGCYIWYSEEGPRRAAAPPSLLLAVPHVTAHPSTASVLIAVLLYDGPLLCGFNVAIKELMRIELRLLNWHLNKATLDGMTNGQCIEIGFLALCQQRHVTSTPAAAVTSVSI